MSRDDPVSEAGADLRRRYAALVSAGRDLLVELTADGRLVYASPNFQGVLGHEPAAWVGRPCADLVEPDDRERFAALLGKGARDTSAPESFRLADGQRRPLAFEAHVLRESGDETSLIVFRNVSERVRVQERAERLSLYDELTELPNRRHLQNTLGKTLERADRRGHGMALLILGLDGFRHINDAFGHGVGDRILQHAASRLTGCVRVGDHLARLDAAAPEPRISRLGGDEFAVVLPEISEPQDVAKVARRLLNALSEPFDAAQEVFTSASIGVAIFPVDGSDAQTLMRNAGAALHHAKRRGRSNFQFHSRAMNQAALRRTQLAGRLRGALARGEIALHYQPLRDAKTSRITAAEALLRWKDPETGDVRPEELIPLAEETGLIVPIGAWVLRTACAQAQRWRAAGYRPIRMAVNLSSHEVRHPDWVMTLAQILEETGLSPAQLELEITERTFVQEDEATAQAFRRVGEMGIGLALDDFGTGYSSLSYLRRFCFDRVKIDRSFVSQVSADSDAGQLIEAVITLAHSLGLKVVAEEVETVEQAAALRERGCDELQGFLFSPALPAEDFVRFLEREKDHEPEADAPEAR